MDVSNSEKGFALLEAMSFLDAELLDELPAPTACSPEKAAWTRWGALAASLVIVMGAAALLPRVISQDPAESGLPEYTQGTWSGDGIEVSGVGVMPNVTGQEHDIPMVTTGADLTMPQVTGVIGEETKVLIMPDGSVVRVPESKEPAVVIPSVSRVDYFPLDGKTALYIQEDDRRIPVDGRYVIEKNGKLWRFQYFIGDGWSSEEHFAVYGIADSGDILSVVTYERNTIAHEWEELTDEAVIMGLFEAMKTAKTGSREGWAQDGGRIESESGRETKTVLNLSIRTKRGEMECFLYPYADVIMIAGLEAVFSLDEGEGNELFAALKGIEVGEIDGFIAAALDAEEAYRAAHTSGEIETAAAVIGE